LTFSFLFVEFSEFLIISLFLFHFFFSVLWFLFIILLKVQHVFAVTWIRRKWVDFIFADIWEILIIIPISNSIEFKVTIPDAFSFGNEFNYIVLRINLKIISFAKWFVSDNKSLNNFWFDFINCTLDFIDRILFGK